VSPTRAERRASNSGARAAAGGAVAGGVHPLLRRVRVSEKERLMACSPVESVHLVPGSLLGVLGQRSEAMTAAAAAGSGTLESCPQPVLCIEQCGQVRGRVRTACMRTSSGGLFFVGAPFHCPISLAWLAS
jgi:hypothetical protein